jgi:tetratricopeptide (TPR) repeat protein
VDSAVATVIAALIGFWGVIYQRTGKLFWWRKPNSSPIKPPAGNHNSSSSDAYALNERGMSSYDQGQYQSALNYFQQALVIRREVGDRAGEGATLNNIGGVYDSRGQYDQAFQNFQQALVILREVGDRVGEGTTLNNVGSVYRARGQYDQAFQNF